MRRLLTEAGITTGMAVLDLGTGTGDVAMLTAEMVGCQRSLRHAQVRQ